MSLGIFIKSLKRDTILLPILKAHLAHERRQMALGKLSSKDIVIQDAKMTIACFKARMSEYNHREQLEGEYFHPSALGQCLRAMFFDAKGAPVDKPTSDDSFRSELIFEFGTYVHVLFQNLCERAGVLKRREVAIKDAVNRHLGHADGVLDIDKTEYLLEIKTINARGFGELKSVKEAHKRQIHAYMKSLKLTWTIVIYFNKDTSNIKEFVVPYSEEYYRKECATRIDTFFRSVRSCALPKREGDNPNRMPCSYCPHKRMCYNETELQQWLAKVQNETEKTVKALKPKIPTLRRRGNLTKVFKISRRQPSVVH